ncbi:manganese efflux pump MntP [Rheinheimera salexigens]|uniref:Putative manganese efflux pump MntP n=1 Tax=Rheinheimera salexigens TaxID=1628148 RepID=A0A1E7Q6S1_9GAMM|nr:manganese efflux pump MntP family protein [Rheinheimera salexigens]OEY69827.1 manganese efflux pump MntP [Rheinheimera salexigens]
MLEIILLAVALSMDAFAVAIGLGSKHKLKPKKLAIMAAIYFGLFQGVMPLIGYLAGMGVIGWIEAYAKWLAFILLFLVGAKMIYEAFSAGIEDDLQNISHRIMLVLAIATSIDAMAAGFALTVLNINPFIACAIIALITALFSYIGVYVGAKSGAKLESKAELLGGIVLILIGLKIVFM